MTTSKPLLPTAHLTEALQIIAKIHPPYRIVLGLPNYPELPPLQPQGAHENLTSWLYIHNSKVYQLDPVVATTANCLSNSSTSRQCFLAYSFSGSRSLASWSTVRAIFNTSRALRLSWGWSIRCLAIKLAASPRVSNHKAFLRRKT